MKRKLYIQMFSIHGLVRSHDMELGRDADTGGQIKYVIELCTYLSKHEQVDRVDLFTRWISDKTVSEDYSRSVEEVNEKFRIQRIRCGGAKYIRKELLWPHLDEYIDKTVKLIKREFRLPDIVHGHYPDGGYVAMELARIFGVPLVYTGHSLGRVKKEKLLQDGMSEEEMIRKYKIDRRIYAEEDVLRYADLVITSTRQEIDAQYGLYRNKGLPDYQVIPPGLDIEKFYPYYHDFLPARVKDEQDTYAHASVVSELSRFFMYPDRPLILSLCRPDQKKNIAGLVKAYGEDRELQAMANLAVFAGIRKDITQMEDNERNVLTEMLLLMDKYDLYGKMAIPKKHDFEHEVPCMYRIVAGKKGVFVNPALTEPFGLTLLEASATGVPIVATNDGGPRDIMENCQSGLLIDPMDTTAMASAIKQIISSSETWDRFSKNGILNVRKHYTWRQHANHYVMALQALKGAETARDVQRTEPPNTIGQRLARLNYFLITDIDNTLIGATNEGLPVLTALLTENRATMGFGVATGRTVDSAVSFLLQHGVPQPDVLITSVGTEIYFGKQLHYGKGWDTHISSGWDRDKIVRLLEEFDFLEYQEAASQRKFKVSYNMDPGKDRLAVIHDTLLRNKCRYYLIYSHDRYLDILPYRASKGKAIRYLSYQWEIPMTNILVCGDSGNDEEMLRGEPPAVVVGNYSPELEKLRGAKRIYFAAEKCAGGILEAIAHYKFIDRTKGDTP